jgi:hypothetical protein
VDIRPFDWRDLPKLHTYRDETLYLNKALLLTRGPLQTLGAVLASVVPSMGIITSVAESGPPADQSIIGQVIHHAGDPYAYVSFLAPESHLSVETLPPLMNHLVAQAGGRGVLRILAELDESSHVLEAFRYSGFAIYMRQRVWLLSEKNQSTSQMGNWRSATERDLLAIRLLYGNLVPGLVQQVDPVSFDRPRGLVYYREGELQAYVELRYGIRGIWARPFVHPDVESATQELVDLLLTLPSRHARPVYVCISAYQSWMENVLELLNALPLERQILLVKHLAVKRSVEQTLAVPGLEGQTETFAFSDLEKTNVL